MHLDYNVYRRVVPASALLPVPVHLTKVWLHDNNSKFLMSHVASGCCDPFGADDRPGGTLAKCVAQVGGENAFAAKDAGDC
jgi:hypothetical protein